MWDLRAFFACSALAVSLGLSFVACGKASNQLPPPDPGTGGGLPTSTTTTLGKSENLCDCLSMWTTSSVDPKFDCGTCVNTQAEGACAAEWNLCQQTPGCQLIIYEDCIKTKCNWDPACMADCFLPLDVDPARQVFADMVTCVCAGCSKKCANPEDVACMPSGTGGGGGTGGTGGAGGAGGTGGGATP